MAGRDHSPRALSRRQFLEQMAAATLAARATGAARPVRGAEAGEPLRHPEPTADCCILLWMAGGMASPETFDPKLYAPLGRAAGREDPEHVPGHRHGRR
jgi:hypothetical protein